MAQFRTMPVAARRQSRAVVAAWAAGVLTFIVILGLGAFAILRWLVDVLSSAG